MNAIAQATVPADQFALGEAFRRIPNLEFRVVRLVAHRSGGVMPFLRVDCDDLDRLLDATERDSGVEEAETLEAFDSGCLLQVEWDACVQAFATALSRADATILDARGRDGTWYFQLFFPGHDRILPTQELCEDHDIDVSVDRIDRLPESSGYGQFGLTDRQYEALHSAYGCGYYDVPRQVNQAELAERFDVSHQALSERLRRAHQTIIRNALDHRIQQRDEVASQMYLKSDS